MRPFKMHSASQSAGWQISLGPLVIWVLGTIIVLGALVIVYTLPLVLVSESGLDAEGRLKAENDLRTTLVQTFGGAVVLVGTARTLQINREGQITERFTRAIDQLGQPGREKLDVRLGGIYALERIARGSKPDRGPIVEVLTAFLREHARWDPDSSPHPRAKVGDMDKQASPSELDDRSEGADAPRLRADFQAVATVLGRNSWSGKHEVDLHEVDLRAVFLVGARLERAILSNARLDQANLYGAQLTGAALHGAHLEMANLRDADLGWAALPRASLKGVTLRGARLNKATLGGAHLDRADLRDAHLEEADLRGAHLEGADLRGAHLEGANFRGARLEGTNFEGAHLAGAHHLPLEALFGVADGYPGRVKQEEEIGDGAPPSE